MTTMTTAKERPILFSGPMVRAILEGRKTQTRRVVMSGAKNMQASGAVCVKRNPDNDPWYKEYVWSVRERGGVWNDFTEEQMLARCPYGVVGDRLWVRETWAEFPSDKDWIYRADHDRTLAEKLTWKPSIFMPRQACRIKLEITARRLEQLQRMSHNDWKADFAPTGRQIEQALQTFKGDDNRHEMSQIFWDSINAKRGYSWTSNPWVWVIEFERVQA